MSHIITCMLDCTRIEETGYRTHDADGTETVHYQRRAKLMPVRASKDNEEHNQFFQYTPAGEVKCDAPDWLRPCGTAYLHLTRVESPPATQEEYEAANPGAGRLLRVATMTSHPGDQRDATLQCHWYGNAMGSGHGWAIRLSVDRPEAHGWFQVGTVYAAELVPV